VLDVGACVRGVVRARDLERLHVAVEEELVGERELVVGPAAAARSSGEHVVDVCHVAAGLDRDAQRVRHRGDQVGPHERRRVAEMGDVVRRDAARVEPDRTDQGERLPRQGQAAAQDGLGVDGGDPARKTDHSGGQA